ncbi:MAG: papain-like cysteine protease family protein [Spongiibacteraceae bacterium]
MTAQIRPNRLSVSDRFPMLGFTIRTGQQVSRRAEVTLAADPVLFRNREGRRVDNFFSTSSLGALTITEGEAAYVVPTEVIARFIGMEKLYFALATGPIEGGALTVDVMPDINSPYISLAGLSGRSLRRVRMFAQRTSRQGQAYGDPAVSLNWAGDAASPGMDAANRNTSNSKANKNVNNGSGAGQGNASGNANARPPSANDNNAGIGSDSGADYDDGFGAIPELPSNTTARDDALRANTSSVNSAGDDMTGTAQTLARAMDVGDIQLGARHSLTTPDASPLDGLVKAGVEAALASNTSINLMATAARVAANSGNISIGVGPAVSGGLGAGGQLSVGVIFAPGNQLGVYGSADALIGAIASIGATMQVTILRGGIASFNGMSMAVGFSAGEGVVAGGQVILDAQGAFLGVSFQVGIGVGLSPLEVFTAIEQGVATQLGSMSGQQPAQTLNDSHNPYAVEVKYRMFIPSPVIEGPPGYDDFGGDNRSFRYSGGSSRGELIATVNLSSGMGIESIDVTRRSWGKSTAYASDNTFHVAGKPDWWMDKNADAAITEEETLTATTDNLNIIPGTSGNRGIRVYTENASAVTISATGTNPLVAVAPAIDVDLSVLFRLHNGLIQAKALGNHDGFPAHELYVNGELIHRYDPVAAGNGPSSLFGSSDQNVDSDWVTVARIYTVRTGANALTFNESFTLNWDELELINQPTSMSCWAAAGAMVVGWRDRQSLTPETIAAIGGRTTANGLNPQQVGQFAADMGLISEPPMSWSQQGFRQLLENNGPLWVASAPAGLHAIVVTGIYNDGDQVYLRISDPWDRAVGSPGSPGAYASTHVTGSRYIMTWEDFTAEYERPAHAGLIFLQILHADGNDGRQPNRGGHTPPGYAQSLTATPPPTTAVNPEQASVPATASKPLPPPVTARPSASLQLTLADQSMPVVPPLTTTVNYNNGDGTNGAAENPWGIMVAEFDQGLMTTLVAIPVLAAAKSWTIGVGRESSGGSIGSGIGVSAEGKLFRYSPPQAQSVAQQASAEALMVTVVEGGIDAFTGWSKARAFTASDGVTGALLLNVENVPLGAAMRLAPSENLTQRIETVVNALHKAHAATTSASTTTGSLPPVVTPPVPTPAPAAQPPTAVALANTYGDRSDTGIPGYSATMQAETIPPSDTFPPPGVAIFRSQREVNGVNYSLFLMDGSVLPSMPPAMAADLLPAEQLVIDAWPYIDGPSGRSHGGLAIDWSYAAGAVANVRITPQGGAALDGWHISVVADIAAGASTSTETQLKVTITTTFERDGEEPQAGVTEVILTGSGQHETIYRKLPAIAPVAA